jgi:phospholipase C
MDPVMHRALPLLALLLIVALPHPVQARDALYRLQNIIVIYQENWSFDGLYGLFPGANGIANAGAALRQLDKNGEPYRTLPIAKEGQDNAAKLPEQLPVAPFDLAQYLSPEEKTSDLVHRYYQEQMQINGGKMDKFVAFSDAAGLVLSYYDATNMPEGKLAQKYTLLDNFFHAAFGGSFLNHFWLVCACTPQWPNPPAAMVAQLDAQGAMLVDGSVTPDGYAVNTAYSINRPRSPKAGDPTRLLPDQHMPTIGDRLSEKGISWAWYAGGWNDAIAGRADPLFQYHHQPFIYFSNFADGTRGKAAHLKDEKEFLAALKRGSLPHVAFVKPLGPDNEHPGYANLARGQKHVADLVAAVKRSRYWPHAAIIITYDENGGRWDHVAPPKGDRWGPGTRVPAMVISPFAKKGYVDHTQYDTTSILKLIERRWRLQPLGTRDAEANDLTNAFNF